MNEIENLQLISDDRHKQITVLETRIKYLEGKLSQQEHALYMAVGEWLEGNIMRTDNRVTKLWVLGDLAKSLKQGQLPK